MTTLILSNEEMDDFMKIIKSLEESGSLIKGVSETIKNEAKKQKRLISPYIIRFIRCQFIKNLLTSKGVIRAGERMIRAGQDF